MKIWLTILGFIALSPLLAGLIKAWTSTYTIKEVFSYYHWFFIITIPTSGILLFITLIIYWLRK